MSYSPENPSSLGQTPLRPAVSWIFGDHEPEEVDHLERQSLPPLFWLGLVLCLVPFVSLVVSQWGVHPHAKDGDYAQYLLHAQALVDGNEYSDIGFIYTNYNNFIGPKAEPPGLPLTLYPILRFIGRSPAAWTWLMMLSTFLFVGLAGYWLASRGETLLALASVAIAGIGLADDRIASLGSDPGFCAALWGVFVLADQRRWSVARTVAITGFAGLAIFYRIAGIALIPAFLFFGLLNFRRFRFRPLVPALGCAALFVSMDWLLAMSGAVGSEMSLRPSALLATAATNLATYKDAVFSGTLYPFAWDPLNDAYHLVASVFLLVGCLVWVRASFRTMLFAFTLAYSSMLIVTPTNDGRYLWPFFPLFAYWLLIGVRVTLNRIHGSLRSRSTALVLAMAAVLCALGLARSLTMVSPESPSLVGGADGRELFAFLKKDASRDNVRALFFKPRVLSWETGIPAMGTFVAEPDAIVDELRANEISHVIVGDLGVHRLRTRALRDAVASCDSCFDLTYANASFQVYRLSDSPRPVTP